ncbi:MAG: hypothetical protein HYX27_09185 [Acidobacteria bacterium]|nr:hypothetical protein [Acidobacteriota bacterium]
MISFRVSEPDISKIEAGLRFSGAESVSEYARLAILEKLDRDVTAKPETAQISTLERHLSDINRAVQFIADQIGTYANQRPAVGITPSEAGWLSLPELPSRQHAPLKSKGAGRVSSHVRS